MANEVAMVPVASSNLSSVGYDNGNLFVRFQKGGLLRYKDVPRRDYEELLAAPSVGKFFHQRIRSVYEWERIGD